MFRPSVPAVMLPALLAAIAGCNGSAPSNTSDHQMAAGVSHMKLTSPAFADGKPIPSIYGCDERNISPPLAWTGVPDGTRSLALSIDDPDAKQAPGGVFRHWAAYDIPSTVRDLAEGSGEAANAALKQSLNDGGKPGYTGMCPPKGDAPHHYHFRLFALDVENLTLPANAKVKEVEDAAAGHILGQAELIGTFERR
jgi:Raf kinase inhibitor-like YbhB/YbcL family protein